MSGSPLTATEEPTFRFGGFVPAGDMRAVVNECGPNLCVRRVQTARTRASCPVCIFQAERNISCALRANIAVSDHLHLRHKQKLHQLRQTAASSIQSSLGRPSEHLARQELPSACRPPLREVPDSLPSRSRVLFPRERAQAACSPSRDHRQKKMSLNASIPSQKIAFGFECCQRAHTSNHRGSTVFSARHLQTKKADRPTCVEGHSRPN
jgi:hypothetical protein